MKWSIIIPTIWKSEFTLDLLMRYQESPLVSEIILINNDPKTTPAGLTGLSKLVHHQVENIYVNPAWNLGVLMAKNENILISNDDVLFDVNSALEFVGNLDYDVIGVHPQSYKEKADSFQIAHGSAIGGGWGCLIFVKKSNWIDVPDQLKIWFGDNWIVKNASDVKSLLYKGGIVTKMSTSAGSPEVQHIIRRDKLFWKEINSMQI